MVQSLRQAGVQIEVTSAMVEAGRIIAIDYCTEDDPLTDHLAELYRAMQEASPPFP